MSINLSCYCSEPSEKIADRLVALREARSDLFADNHHMHEPDSLVDPKPWNELRKSVALGFGIVAKSYIFISVNKWHADQIQEIADSIYECIDANQIVVTFQNDYIIPFRGKKSS
jgi:hypothetical protein